LSGLRKKNNQQVSPSGYGIHWPTLNEDLSIDILIRIIPLPITILRKSQKPSRQPCSGSQEKSLKMSLKTAALKFFC
jgi:hypothetical protein